MQQLRTDTIWPHLWPLLPKEQISKSLRLIIEAGRRLNLPLEAGERPNRYQSLRLMVVPTEVAFGTLLLRGWVDISELHGIGRDTYYLYDETFTYQDACNRIASLYQAGYITKALIWSPLYNKWVSLFKVVSRLEAYMFDNPEYFDLK